MILMPILNSLLENNSFKKLKDYLFEVDDVISLQSSHYYKNASDELGFYTIAQHNENYRKKIGEMIEEFTTLRKETNPITILELGGGTGKFSSYMTKYLSEKGIKFEYTIVDVSTAQYSEELRKNKDLTIIESSFTEFALKNKKQFDVLLMNEALDMWAGKQEVVNEWTQEIQPYHPYWVLIDIEKRKPVKSKEAKKIDEQSEKKYTWLQVYHETESNTIREKRQQETLNKIRIPKSFEKLIQNINLFTVIQDYWSFEDQENTLRMGLYDGSIEKTIDLIQNIEKEEKERMVKTWTEEVKQGTGIRNWIKSELIPFGKVDVTYSPDQSELLDLSMELGLEIMKNTSDDIEKYDNTIFRMGEQDNEIFMLFTKKALELQFERL